MSAAEVHNVLRRLDTIRAKLADYASFTAASLATEFGVNQKTCARDFKILREFYGVQMEYDQVYRTYYLIDPGHDYALRYMLQQTFSR